MVAISCSFKWHAPSYLFYIDHPGTFFKQQLDFLIEISYLRTLLISPNSSDVAIYVFTYLSH